MRTDAPPLLPIFRSANQADVLAMLFLHPESDYTLADLARKLGVRPSTLHRDIHRLIEADLIRARPVGRSQLLHANTANRLSGPLTQLLVMTVGPQVVIADEFAPLDGADAVVIYGSWAARYHGEPGPPPNDVDVLVLGRPARGDVYDAADRAQQRIGFPVNPVIRPGERWVDPADPLIQQVKTSPLVVAFGEIPIDRG
ncbi:winged helix-turn-helix domain-containing protein [Actinoallomurus sp. NPDC052274]|uniref:winged helix-turn-helix domain-containing protein n=1 Tax=Actinoallomurus sp. NPDC052274 TaxID=3155420 RepID=UPI0034481D62